MSLQPENTSKVQGQAAYTLSQKAFTKEAGALKFIKAAPMDLCPCTGP